MPEGHTMHRYARLHRDVLAGRRVAVSSPQGRFTEGAARLDGRVLTSVEAVGKHLLYRFAGAPVLHVHLGLFGRFATVEAPDGAASVPSRPRLRMRADAAGGPEGAAGAGRSRPATEVRLSGPTACELLDPAGEQALRGRLGPDPLDPGADPAPFAAALARRRVALGQALLDQSVIAGVGNAFRAEALFVRGLDPGLPARTLPEAEVSALWEALRGMLREGERTGRIVTVAPADRTLPSPDAPTEDAPTEDAPTDDARYVYRREGLPCRRCGTPIRAWDLGGRKMYACPACQVSRPSG